MNAYYTSFKKQMLDSDGAALLADNIKVALVTQAGYTFSAAHDFLDDVPGAAIKATSGNLGSKTTTGGTFDAADASFGAVAATTPCALVMYQDSGSPATSRLICYIDTGTNLPITPNGGTLDLVFNASGIFTFSG